MSQPAPRAVRRRWRARRRFWWLAGVVVIGIFALVGLSIGWFLGQIQVPGAEPTNDPTVITGLGAPDARINVVLMGHDVAQLANGHKQPTRTDTIMVASFDPLTHEVDLLSIPRDTRVSIPGREGFDKINAAHAYGGPSLTLQTVSGFLGVPIPDYVDIGVEGFQKIVDQLGGVDVVVPFDMNYDDPAQDLHIHLKKGPHHLDGYQAMGFVRDRYDDPRNDFGRIDRQHQFLAAMVKKMVQPTAWLKVPGLMRTLADAVRTTMDVTTMFNLAKIGHAAGVDGLVATTIPTKDLWLNGISYQDASRATVKKYVDRYILGIDPDANAKVRVRVLNGTTVPDLASSMSTYLQRMGYNVVQVGNATTPNDDTTAIYAQSEATTAAKVLVRTLHSVWADIDEPYTADSLDPKDRVMTSEQASEFASEANGTVSEAKPDRSESVSEISTESSSEVEPGGWDVTIVIGTDVAQTGVPSPASTPSEAGKSH